jgi:hypothetical protein
MKVLFAAMILAAEPGPGLALREASPRECLPVVGDHTFLIAPHGWRGRSPDGRRLLRFETGRYGLVLDAERLRVLGLGPTGPARPYAEAVSPESGAAPGVAPALPREGLEIALVVDGIRYRTVRGAVGEEELDFPVRLIEGGRLLQRVDILRLEFEDAAGRRFPARARLEIVVWPDRLSLIAFAAPERDLAGGRIEISLGERKGAPSPDGPWKAGEERSAWISWTPRPPDGSDPPADPSPQVAAEDPKRGAPVPVRADEARGWVAIELPREDWRESEDLDHLERVRLLVSNPSDRPAPVRLLFAKDASFAGITGLTPILRDGRGEPTGIPVQVSKNWHRREERRLLHEGPWLHAFALLRMPPRSAVRLEVAIAYGRWGGVPAASHAQLCLIGWGTNGLWDQAAIGSWGESICYDPEVCLNRSMVDDLRPLLVHAMGGKDRRYSWTNNVGGGDFLVLLDRDGRLRPLTGMRTAYLAHGPNLTRVVYAGGTEDGAVMARIDVSTPRTDDLNRAFHRFRYDVRRPVPFSRLAFCQVGADRYNDHRFRILARGSEAGLAEEWEFEPGGRRYDRRGMFLEGEAPWLSLHRAVSGAREGGAWAARGLVVRSWRARLGGKDAPPFASCYGTADGVPSMNVELSAPPGLETLLEGDFVEAEVELAVFPLSADDYYGPDANLRAALAEGGDTWRPVHREAVLNTLAVRALRGRVLRRYPVEIEAGPEGAEIEVTGGAGFIPLSFLGLDRPDGWRLSMAAAGGPEAPVDQSVHGNDFWQADHDPASGTWTLTFNVPSGAPGDKARTIRLRLARN